MYSGNSHVAIRNLPPSRGQYSLVRVISTVIEGPGSCDLVDQLTVENQRPRSSYFVFFSFSDTSTVGPSGPKQGYAESYEGQSSPF